jgi:hypothetical protein
MNTALKKVYDLVLVSFIFYLISSRQFDHGDIATQRGKIIQLIFKNLPNSFCQLQPWLEW